VLDFRRKRPAWDSYLIPAATKGYKPYRQLCRGLRNALPPKDAEAQAQTAKMMDKLQKMSVGDTVFVGLQAEDIHRVRSQMENEFPARLTDPVSQVLGRLRY